MNKNSLPQQSPIAPELINFYPSGEKKMVPYGWNRHQSTLGGIEWNVMQIGSSGYYRITNVKNGLDMAGLNASFGNSGEIIQHTYTSVPPVNDEWPLCLWEVIIK